MAITLPLRTDLTHYDFFLPLEGVTYLFEFRYNTREGSWYMDLRLEDETAISLSRKVVLDFPLASRTRDRNKPPGALLAQDTSGLSLPPSISDLGTRVQILYFTRQEVVESL